MQLVTVEVMLYWRDLLESHLFQKKRILLHHGGLYRLVQRDFKTSGRLVEGPREAASSYKESARLHDVVYDTIRDAILTCARKPT